MIPEQEVNLYRKLQQRVDHYKNQNKGLNNYKNQSKELDHNNPSVIYTLNIFTGKGQP